MSEKSTIRLAIRKWHFRDNLKSSFQVEYLETNLKIDDEVFTDNLLFIRLDLSN